jgi:ABC-type branched-subunit amino acid transport system ATPase component
MTILPVKPNAARALTIPHNGYVLETGEIILWGEAHPELGEEKGKQACPGV